MAHPFEFDPSEPQSFSAALTTAERLVLSQVVGDVIELLGAPDDEPENPEQTAPESGTRIPSGPNVIVNLLHLFDSPQSVTVPQDPAILRLLPSASLDEDVALEFRRFTENELRDTKVTRLLGLSRLLLSVPSNVEQDVHLPLTVSVDQAPALASAMTDVRLVLAQRLGLETEEDSDVISDLVHLTMTQSDHDQLTEDEYRRYLLGSLYTVVGYLLESLSQCMLDRFRANSAQNE